MLSTMIRIAWVAALGTTAVFAASSEKRAESADAHILDVVAITEVFADGLKTSAVAIKYDRNISDASLQPTDFAVQTDVPGQKITRVYTSEDGLQTTRRGLNGPYVILELATDYVLPIPARKAQTPPPAARPPAPQQAAPEPAKKEPIVLNPEVVAQVGTIVWDPAAHPATLKSSKHGGNGKSVTVNQVGEVTAKDGMTLTATTVAKDNFYVRNLLVDGFMKPDFTSSAQGNVKYNIHFPSNYDPNKKYPVVVFMSDSDSPSGYTHAEYLIHGLGATVWASKEDEARHPAIVLVPTYPRALIDERYEPAVQTRANGQTSNSYLAILDCLDGLLAQIPSVDKNRIYLTGQGDGARAGLRLMTDRPELFAAALLFAPDYDASRAAPLSKAKMWIVAAEADEDSHASMETFTAGLAAGGARIAKAEWSGRFTSAQFASAVRGLAGEGKNIEYSVLKKGTVVPAGVSDDVAANHVYTWRVGYAIQPLRDWLFTQHK